MFAQKFHATTKKTEMNVKTSVKTPATNPIRTWLMKAFVNISSPFKVETRHEKNRRDDL